MGGVGNGGDEGAGSEGGVVVRRAFVSASLFAVDRSPRRLVRVREACWWAERGRASDATHSRVAGNEVLAPDRSDRLAWRRRHSVQQTRVSVLPCKLTI